MGKYIDAIKNTNFSGFDNILVVQNDTITKAINTAVQETSDKLGGAVIFVNWFLIAFYIAKPENNFGLSTPQALLSASALILAFCLILLFIGLLLSIKIFVWIVLGMFMFQTWNIFRTTN